MFLGVPLLAGVGWASRILFGQSEPTVDRVEKEFQYLETRWVSTVVQAKGPQEQGWSPGLGCSWSVFLLGVQFHTGRLLFFSAVWNCVARSLACTILLFTNLVSRCWLLLLLCPKVRFSFFLFGFAAFSSENYLLSVLKVISHYLLKYCISSLFLMPWLDITCCLFSTFSACVFAAFLWLLQIV